MTSTWPDERFESLSASRYDPMTHPAKYSDWTYEIPLDPGPGEGLYEITVATEGGPVTFDAYHTPGPVSHLSYRLGDARALLGPADEEDWVRTGLDLDLCDGARAAILTNDEQEQPMQSTVVWPKQVRGTPDEPFAMFHVAIRLEGDDEAYEVVIPSPGDDTLLALISEYRDITVGTPQTPNDAAMTALARFILDHMYDDGFGRGRDLRGDQELRAALAPVKASVGSV